MKLVILAVLALLPLAAGPREDLDLLLRTLQPSQPPQTGRINATDKTWEEWQKRTGELPPDFSKLPAQPFLPELKLEQKKWVREQFEQWVYGHMPPPPGNVSATEVSEKIENGIRVRDLVLRFGPDRKASLRVQLLIPRGAGPHPVFLTNHPRTRPWVATAVRRGYIGAIYYAADPLYGNADDSDPWIEIYPQYDWSCIARWAWAAQRTVDYLVGLPEVDPARIAITGHSRNGKQAMLAAAFDDRIGAIALSSGNTGEGNPWRYTHPIFANESIEQITTNFPHWFHPRLRFFAGREHKLPVDQNSLMMLIAPRGLLLASAYSEHQGAPFGFEQAYRSVRKVYETLGVPNKVGLSLRAGEHATTAEDIEQYVDFFDKVFGRSPGRPPETFLLGYRFQDWLMRSAEKRPGAVKGDTAARLRWMLGDEPPFVAFPSARNLREPVRTSEGWMAELYHLPLRIPGARAAGLAFGDDLKADVYLPEKVSGKVPAVIYLHGLSHQSGYSRGVQALFSGLIANGFAVIAYDQVGFGSRIQSASRFYQRYPHWSMLGRMVADAHAAVQAAGALEEVDASKIYLLGNNIGSRVALYASHRNEAVAGIALLGGVGELHPEGEGLKHFSHLHGFLPRLGLVDAIPVADAELLTEWQRPALWIAPRGDRFFTPGRRPNSAALALEEVDDYHAFTVRCQRRAIDWFSERLGRTAKAKAPATVQ